MTVSKAPCLAPFVIASRPCGVAIQGPGVVLAASGLPRRCALRNDVDTMDANGLWHQSVCRAAWQGKPWIRLFVESYAPSAVMDDEVASQT